MTLPQKAMKAAFSKGSNKYHWETYARQMMPKSLRTSQLTFTQNVAIIVRQNPEKHMQIITARESKHFQNVRDLLVWCSRRLSSTDMKCLVWNDFTMITGMRTTTLIAKAKPMLTRSEIQS